MYTWTSIRASLILASFERKKNAFMTMIPTRIMHTHISTCTSVYSKTPSLEPCFPLTKDARSVV